MVRPLMIVVILAVSTLFAASAHARRYDPEHGWFVEASVGGVQPGPDGTDFGAGQDYGAALGRQWHPNADIALVVGWVNARKQEEALETDITSASVRGRAWMGTNRWSGYGEASAGIYRVNWVLNSLPGPFDDTVINVGGEVGAGVLYSRNTWWLGLGASLHGVVDAAGFEGGNMLTYSAIRVFIGGPTGW